MRRTAFSARSMSCRSNTRDDHAAPGAVVAMKEPGPRTSSPAGMNAPDFLVESIPNLLHSGEPAAPPQNPWLGLIFPLVLSLAAGMLCYWAARATLGLFLGGIICAALLTGPLSPRRRRGLAACWRRRAWCTASRRSG